VVLVRLTGDLFTHFTDLHNTTATPSSHNVLRNGDEIGRNTGGTEDVSVVIHDVTEIF
jgi:hypothetical protein